MKTMIAGLAVLALAVSPAVAGNSHIKHLKDGQIASVRHLKEGRASANFRQSNEPQVKQEYSDWLIGPGH